MSAIVNIEDAAYEPIRFDKRSVLAMIEAGLLPDDRKVEMIDGVLVTRSPAKNDHAVALAYLIAALLPQLDQNWKGATDVAIFLAHNVMLAPDLAVLPSPLRSEDSSGPDLALAIEIGDATVERDLSDKAPRYARYGVRELWIVDLPERCIHVHLQPQDDGYSSVTRHGWSETVHTNVLAGISFNAARDLPI